MLEIVAIVAIGLGSASILFAGFKLFRRTPPKYLIPLISGGGMVLFSIYNDYDWAPRARATLPDGVVIAEERETSNGLKPWSLFVPVVEQMVIFDKLKLRRHAMQTNFVMVESVMMSRYLKAEEQFHVIDCDAGKRLDLVAGVEMNDDGLPTNGEWITLDPSDIMLTGACEAPVPKVPVQ